MSCSSLDSYNDSYSAPSGYTYAKKSWGNIFYKIYGAKNYDDAKAQCKSDGAYLAIPRSEAENDFIAGLIPNADIWIGINDMAKEGSFVAVDGRQVSWTKWDKNEPNNLGANEDAVEIRQVNVHLTIPKSWNDAHGHLLRKFVCISN